jgi:hypothetical protein
MERGLSLSAAAVLRLAARLLLAILFGQASATLADDRLVLVVASNSHISALSSRELHKLYLGLTVMVDDRRVLPVRNDADELMHQVFFQSIVSMSESVYDRRMLTQALQQGAAAPPTLSSTRAVFDRLAQDPDAVSFAWAIDAEKDPRMRVLRLLWRR